MNIENLPRGFKREIECIMCGEITTLYEAFLDEEQGVITRFCCGECKHTQGLIYSGSFIEAFKKAEKAEQEGETQRQEVRTAEDIYA